MGLVMHCGANRATLEEVLAVTTPEPTDTHYPIPHELLINAVIDNLQGIGLSVRDTDWGLWGDEGEMMVGIMSLANGNNGMVADDYEVVLGIRNAHNKRFAAGLACGSHVFVCDNLAMSGDIVVFRKHTKYIQRDLERLLFEALGRLGEAKVAQEKRIANYKSAPLTDVAAHDLLIRAVDAKIIPNAAIPKVLREWREPSYPDFEPRTLWSLFNAFTSEGKRRSPLSLTKRTTTLHGLLDMVVEATENRGLVDDLANGRAILPAVAPPHGLEDLLTTAGDGRVREA